MIINSTLIDLSNDLYDYSDIFPLPYEDNDLNNRTYYDDYYFLNNINNNQTNNLTTSDTITLSSILTFSTPFSYIFLILIVYLILTIILLSFSLYKQRQTEIENFYYGDNDEDVQQTKRSLLWKKFLIDKISKGDMEPLLIDTKSNSSNENDYQMKSTTFPLHIV